MALSSPFRGSRTSGDRDPEYDLCLSEGDLDLVRDLGLGEREASCAGEEARRAEGGVCDRLCDLPRDLVGESDILISGVDEMVDQVRPQCFAIGSES